MVLGIIRKATKVVDKLAHTLGSTRYLYIIRCNKGYTTNGINGMVKKKEKNTQNTQPCVFCVFFNGENHPAPPVWLLRFKQKECTAHPVT